jgi:hypothetical protein
MARMGHDSERAAMIYQQVMSQNVQRPSIRETIPDPGLLHESG